MKYFYNQKDHQYPMENILELERPEEYDCTIFAYTEQKGHLKINALRKTDEADTPLRIEISTVLYFDGPTFWDGANFTVAKPEECIMYLEKLRDFKAMTVEEWLATYTLFVVKASTIDIHILAWNIEQRILKSAKQLYV